MGCRHRGLAAALHGTLVGTIPRGLMMYRSYRNSGCADRFYDYREIEARFNSTGSCGHEIAKGDRIGWHPGLKKTYCTACWVRWCDENAEADRLERQGL